jgi:PncC family amidohydrolase
MHDDIASAARGVAAAVGGRGHRVVTAESVTAGGIATALAAAGGASEWFCGGIVAYQTETKRRVLGVTADRVITEECARQMAEGALAATGADLAVAVTGVGGPDPEEGEPPGTVFICAGSAERWHVFEHRFEGDPPQVVELAVTHALRHLLGAALELRRSA